MRDNVRLHARLCETVCDTMQSQSHTETARARCAPSVEYLGHLLERTRERIERETERQRKRVKGREGEKQREGGRR